MKDGPKILVVSEGPEIARSLRDLGLAPAMVRDLAGIKAIRAAGAAFDLVITEAALPDGNWRDVLQEFAASTTRVVVCARRADPDLWWDVLDCGGYEVLETVSRHELRRVLEGLGQAGERRL